MEQYHVCAAACAGRGRECRGGDLTRSGGAYARRGGLLEFSHVPRDAGPEIIFIHSRWVDEAALQVHAGLAHTARFLERVDALLDQPKEVTRTEMME